MLADEDVLTGRQVERQDVAGVVAREGRLPGLCSSVMKTGMPAITRLKAPWSLCIPTCIAGSFQRITWCSK